MVAPSRSSVTLAGAAAVELACLALIAVSAGAGHSFLLPAARHAFPSWLHGPLPAAGHQLAAAEFSVLALCMVAAYAVIVAVAPRVHGHWPLALAGSAILLAGVAPPLLSADVFSYLAWGRLGAHGVDPYSHAAIAIGHDPVRPFLLWHHGSTPYGPLFTILTIGLAPLGMAGALWTLKAIAALAALVCVLLLARAAEHRGRSPIRAASLFGFNPLVLLYAVGGAHNDMLLELVLLAAALAALAGREAVGAAGAVAAAAVKASAIVAVPFMVAGALRPGRALSAALAAGAALLAIGLAVFGAPLFELATSVSTQQHEVAIHSFPAELARLAGWGTVTGAERAVMTALLAAVMATLLIHVRRGGDWVAATGWAFVALLMTSSWILPWYVVWTLPFAALSGSRRLATAVIALSAAVVLVRMPALS